MKRKFFCLASVLFSVIQTMAVAEVVPYVKDLWPAGSPSVQSALTIPAGKVVVFDQMRISSFSPVSVTMKLSYDNAGSGIDSIQSSAFVIFTNEPAGIMAAVPGDLRLREGWTITNNSPTLITLIGVAMDKADLYAGVGNEINSLESIGGPLLAGVQLDSPRPVVTKVERSEDMKTWTEETDVVLRKTDTAQMEFEADPAQPDAYYRVLARARKSP